MKKLAVAYLLVLAIPFFSIVFGYLSCKDCRETAETSNQKMDIYFNDGGKIRRFKIKRGYVEQLHVPEIRDYLILVVGYPEMSPMARSSVTPKNEMRISITTSTKPTMGEFTVATWNQHKDSHKIGSRTERYVGLEGGYEIYESLPDPNTGITNKTRIFYDENNNIVSDDGFHGSARLLSGLVIRYASSVSYGTDPRKMHTWVKNFLENNLYFNKEE